VLADAIGVSESSLKRWADEGLLEAERTAGGHRRIPVPEAVRFVRQAGLSVVKPDLLGLSGVVEGPGGEEAREQAPDLLFAALMEDQAAAARSLIVSLYLEGASLGWIFDGPIRDALARVGELWEHEASGVFIEHRATETCVHALSELRLLVPPAPPGSPVALGGGFEGDVYLVPSAMAALVLAEAGFEARNLGPDTPVNATVAAVRHYRPQLVWQSFSVPPRNPREAAAGLSRIADALGTGTLVFGGRGSGSVPVPGSPTTHRMDSMVELAAFARGAASPAALS